MLKDYGKGKPQIILMASGSEVGLIVEAGKRLAEKGVAVRLVSVPELASSSIEQDQAYKDSVLPAGRHGTAGRGSGHHAWAGTSWVGSKGRVLGIDHYGASAPAATVFEKFGLTVDNVVKIAEELL